MFRSVNFSDLISAGPFIQLGYGQLLSVHTVVHHGQLVHLPTSQSYIINLNTIIHFFQSIFVYIFPNSIERELLQTTYIWL